jgi:uncharacterized integral membrane protein
VFIGFPYRMMTQEMITMMLPTIMFNIQVTPIMVNYTMYYETWPEFLVHMCAIMGGIFAATSIFQSMLQSVSRGGSDAKKTG